MFRKVAGQQSKLSHTGHVVFSLTESLAWKQPRVQVSNFWNGIVLQDPLSRAENESKGSQTSCCPVRRRTGDRGWGEKHLQTRREENGPGVGLEHKIISTLNAPEPESEGEGGLAAAHCVAGDTGAAAW